MTNKWNEKLHTPSHWIKKGKENEYDLTMHIGGLESDASWPMYSFDRPAMILWNSIAKELFCNGWTDEQIREWLQSKSPRYALDDGLGEMLVKIGKYYGSHVALTEKPIKGE